MNTPFINVFIEPTYGNHSCRIKWTTKEDAPDGFYYIFKSDTGTKPWTCLNPDKPVIHSNYYEDETFTVLNIHDTTHYAVVLEVPFDGNTNPDDKPKEVFKSPQVGIFEKLTRKEYGMCNKILSLERKKMYAANNGVDVIILKHRRRGTFSQGVDLETGQALSASMVYNSRLDDAWFAYPSRMIIGDLQPVKVEEVNGGEGVSSVNRFAARMLAYPIPSYMDIIVQLNTDDRYGVVSTDVSRFRGNVPLSCDVVLDSIPRNDTRYRIELP